MKTTHPIPDLPPFEPSKAMDLRTAEKLVGVNAMQLQRWATRGVQPLDHGPRYRFPTRRGNKIHMTTPAWCSAWLSFIARVEAADAARQQGIA
jgi:hypothetical protein